jgi:hypothetical protein
MIIEKLDHVPPRLNAAPARRQILGNDLIGFAGSLRLGFGFIERGTSHKRKAVGFPTIF